MVDPSEQDCLRRHLHEGLQLLSPLQQVGQAGALLQGDLVEQTWGQGHRHWGYWSLGSLDTVCILSLVDVTSTWVTCN